MQSFPTAHLFYILENETTKLPADRTTICAELILGLERQRNFRVAFYEVLLKNGLREEVESSRGEVEEAVNFEVKGNLLTPPNGE